MANAIMETQLRDALNADRDLTARGAKAVERQPSGVAIERGPDVLGIWHWRRGQFELHADGSGPIVTVATVAEAVRATRERLTP